MIEPSAAMIEVARQRVQAHVRNFGKPEMINNVSWQCAVLEEALLFDNFADGAIFFEPIIPIPSRTMTTPATTRAWAT